MAKHNRPLVFTAFNGIAFFVLGMVIFQKGPSFNDLILVSNTDVEGGSYYVLASNFGFMLGSLLTGVIYERTWRKTLIVAMSMMLSGAFTILTPWSTVFAAMVVVHAVASIFLSLYETTAMTEEIQAWDGSSESAMQFLTFLMFLGGVFGPLMTEPFMAPKENENNGNNVSLVQSSTYAPSISANYTLESAVNRREMNSYADTNVYNFTRMNIISEMDYREEISTSAEIKSNIHYAYLITGGLSILVSIVFFIISAKSKPKKRVQKEEKDLSCVRKLPRKAYVIIMGIACSYFYLLTMAMDSFDQYRFYFLVTHLDWSKQNGAFLASMHKAITMCIKLLQIAIFRLVKSWIIFVFSILGVIVSLALFCVGAQFQIDEIIWVSTVVLAVSQAPMLSGVLGWTDGNLLKLSGKETSAFMITSSLGAMSAPLPIGYLMKNWSLMTFPYLVLLLAFIACVIFLIMLFIVKPITSKRYGPLRSKVINTLNDNVDDAMIPSEQANQNEGNIEMAEFSNAA